MFVVDKDTSKSQGVNALVRSEQRRRKANARLLERAVCGRARTEKAAQWQGRLAHGSTQTEMVVLGEPDRYACPPPRVWRLLIVVCIQSAAPNISDRHMRFGRPPSIHSEGSDWRGFRVETKGTPK